MWWPKFERMPEILLNVKLNLEAVTKTFETNSFKQQVTQSNSNTGIKKENCISEVYHLPAIFGLATLD
jgi:hypothetical protein